MFHEILIIEQAHKKNGRFLSSFFQYRCESLSDLTFTSVAKRIHMMAFQMHRVTSQNLIIISHIKKDSYWFIWV